MTITEAPDSSASSMISAATRPVCELAHDPGRGDPAAGQHLDGVIDDRLRLVGELLGNRARFPDGHLPDVDDTDLALGSLARSLAADSACCEWSEWSMATRIVSNTLVPLALPVG